MESSSPQDKRSIRHRRLQLEIIDIDCVLERIAILHPNTRRTIDRARDLLGQYSHSISGVVDVREFCGLEKHTTRKMMEEVAA
jgi:hypothetical protein